MTDATEARGSYPLPSDVDTAITKLWVKYNAQGLHSITYLNFAITLTVDNEELKALLPTQINDYSVSVEVRPGMRIQ